MSYEVDNIIVTFSNTEQIEIPIELIGELMFTDHENVFSRVAVNSFLESDIYNFIYFNINRKFAEETKLTSFFGEALNEDMTTLDRISKYKDITHIDIIYNETSSNKPKRITVAWPAEIAEDECYDVNPLQSTRLNDAKDIEVLIATDVSKEKHKSLLEGMQKDFMNVKEMDYKWNMYS